MSLPVSTATRAPWIDALRFAAAAAVFAFHSLYMRAVAPQPEAVQAAAQYGYLGVSAFFMISGYVITMSAEGRTRWAFARARIIRLWPAFLIAACLTQAVRAWDGTAFSASDFLLNLTMVPRLLRVPWLDVVYWSLMWEIVFYAYIAILVGPRFLERLRIACAIWLALALVHRFVRLPLSAQLLLDAAPLFTAGIAMYLVRRDGRRTDKLLAAAAVAVSLLAAGQQSQGMGFAVPPSPWIAAAIVGGAAAALFWATTATSRHGGLLIALGGISYPLYLVHNEIGEALERRLPLAVAALDVLVLATLVWRAELAIRARLQRRSPAPAS